jgi:hypothetical protein
MRSSDTPENDTDAELDTEQAPADWSAEQTSDDRLTGEARGRLERREHRAGDELGGDADVDDEQLVDEP